MGLFYRAMEVGFNFHSVLDFELTQFPRMPIVHDDWLVVIRQTQAGQQCAGDASATEEDDGIIACIFHARAFMRDSGRHCLRL